MDIRRIRAEMRMGRSIFDLPLRVTFYARVSTDQDEQLNSLENQVQYYTELIKSKKNWTFVPGYIDEGISGTTTRRRDDFNRMIRDAKAGLFDFIITKEISRFSRSTLDSIKFTQELLENGVAPNQRTNLRYHLLRPFENGCVYILRTPLISSIGLWSVRISTSARCAILFMIRSYITETPLPARKYTAKIFIFSFINTIPCKYSKFLL